VEGCRFERRVIRVERSGAETTKSGKVRYVPVNSRLLEALKARRENANGELVFHEGNGGMRSTDFRTEIKKAAEKPGIRKIRMHDLRHTFASNYVIKGGNIVSLRKILGHSTINTTLRYVHLAPDFMAKDIERLDFRIQWSPEGGGPLRNRCFSAAYAERGDLKSRAIFL